MALSKQSRILITIGGLVVVLAIGAWYVARALQPREGRVTGVIVAIDPEREVITLRYRHPKTREFETQEGRLAPDARLLLDLPDGERRDIGFDDLRVNDRVYVEGEYSGSGAVANLVRVVERDVDVNQPEPTTEPNLPVGPFDAQEDGAAATTTETLPEPADEPDE